MNETSTQAAANAANSLPALTAPQAGMLDLAITALIVLIAGLFLYRKLWRNRGACPGCSACKKDKGQSACDGDSVTTITRIPANSIGRIDRTKNSAQ
jgi:hypothetical protein